MLLSLMFVSVDNIHSVGRKESYIGIDEDRTQIRSLFLYVNICIYHIAYLVFNVIQLLEISLYMYYTTVTLSLIQTEL